MQRTKETHRLAFGSDICRHLFHLQAIVTASEHVDHLNINRLTQKVTPTGRREVKMGAQARSRKCCGKAHIIPGVGTCSAVVTLAS